MKKKKWIYLTPKLFISLLLIAAAFTAFIFNTAETENTLLNPPPPPVNNNISDNFIIGGIATDGDANFSNLNALHLNLWHKYTWTGTSGWLQRHVPNGWTEYPNCIADTLNGDPIRYSAGIEAVIENINNNNGMRTLLQRPKIEWLCYGKRSDYQCEIIDDNDPLWFYSFQKHETGIPVMDSGQMVVHCRKQADGPNYDDPGYVVRRLKCNTEQSIPLPSGNQWMSSAECNWIVKPRIRIDSTVAHDPSNPLVCKIKVVSGDSTVLLKDVDIHANDFLDENNNYDGRYLDEYNFTGGATLNIHGVWGHLYGLRSRENNLYDYLETNINHRSKVDIQVYWYGNCDMWIDRVRVDDDVADGLMNPKSPNFITYNQWLQWEAEQIAFSSPSPLKFYIELVWFNNIPCIEYVSKKLDALTGGRHIDMVTDITETYGYHGEWFSRDRYFNADNIVTNYVNKVDAKQILLECYPFTSLYNHASDANYYSRIPNTLPYHTPGGEVLAKSVSGPSCLYIMNL